MQDDLTKLKIFQKVLGGYFFETPCRPIKISVRVSCPSSEYSITLCPKKVTFNFWNNSLKNKQISIIFGTRTPEET